MEPGCAVSQLFAAGAFSVKFYLRDARVGQPRGSVQNHSDRIETLGALGREALVGAEVPNGSFVGVVTLQMFTKCLNAR